MNKEKKKNEAYGYLEGEYRLIIKKNEIVLIDECDGLTVTAKCHPDDEWDIGIGVEAVFDKMEAKRLKSEEFDVGDIVEIINNWKVFCTYYEWFNLQPNIKPSIVARYAYGKYPEIGTRCKIVAKGNRKYKAYGVIYLVETLVSGDVYLISKEGIKKVKA